ALSDGYQALYVRTQHHLYGPRLDVGVGRGAGAVYRSRLRRDEHADAGSYEIYERHVKIPAEEGGGAVSAARNHPSAEIELRGADPELDLGRVVGNAEGSAWA